MTAYDFPGLVGGVAGAWLFFFGTLLAVLAGLRVAWAARRPGKGRIARALLSAGGVVAASGIALFWAAERSELRRELDVLAPWVAGLALAAGALAAVWTMRRRAPRLTAEEARDPGAPSDG